MKPLIITLVTTNGGWLARQAVKYSAVIAAATTTYLMGKGLDATHAGVIAAGITSAALGTLEAALSFIARRYTVPELGAISDAIETERNQPPQK